MSVDLGNGSPPTMPRRYPTRKRKAILYTEPNDDDGLNLDQVSDPDVDPDVEPEPATGSEHDSEEDEAWGSRKKVSTSLLRWHHPIVVQFLTEVQSRKSLPKQPKKKAAPKEKPFKFM